MLTRNIAEIFEPLSDPFGDQTIEPNLLSLWALQIPRNYVVPNGGKSDVGFLHVIVSSEPIRYAYNLEQLSPFPDAEPAFIEAGRIGPTPILWVPETRAGGFAPPPDIKIEPYVRRIAVVVDA